MQLKIELIHQWQALGRAHSKLLRNEAFENCKKVGLTSLQSYVYWAEIEKRLGAIDFFPYDELVEKLEKHGLKWVPFLILGPYYATPRWFQKTNDSVYAKCLEHGRETRIQSIWNPHLPKYVDRFLRLFSEHYRNSDVIESIELGISGNWGEALFPTTGGFSPTKDFHTHPGWWCGDKYAISSFRSSMKEKYGSTEKINAAWGEHFSEFDEINYPEISPSFLHWYISSMKNLVEFGTKVVLRRCTAWDRGLIGLMRMKYPSFRSLKKDPRKRRRWLDFVGWYLGSMTRWAEFWIKTTRRYFPNVEIYLATGGDGDPILGADFSNQVRVASKYGAGLRITNQEDDYARNFPLGLLVASASRHYDTYFTTEEAWHSSPQGVVARIFDAATSGAKGVYFKDIISEKIDVAWTKYRGLGKPTPNTPSFVQNVRYLTGEKPIIEAAVLFPNTSIALNPLTLNSIYAKSSQLRDVLDFDYVDENMIANDALRKYRFLIILDGIYVSHQTLMKIEKWVKAGGILIGSSRVNLSAVRQSEKLYENLHLRLGRIKKVGRGYGVISNREGRDYLEFVGQAMYNPERNYPWRGILEIDSEWDGIYATRFRNKIIYFNSTNTLKIKHVSFKVPQKKFEFELEMQPYSIAAITLTPTRVKKQQTKS